VLVGLRYPSLCRLLLNMRERSQNVIAIKDILGRLEVMECRGGESKYDSNSQRTKTRKEMENSSLV
jgi:hypothetical protein